MPLDPQSGKFREYAASTLGISDAELDDLTNTVGEESVVEFVSIMETVFVRDRIPAIVRGSGGALLHGRSLLETFRAEGIASIRACIERLTSWVPASDSASESLALEGGGGRSAPAMRADDPTDLANAQRKRGEILRLMREQSVELGAYDDPDP